MKNIRRSLNKDKSPTNGQTGFRSPPTTSPPLAHQGAFQPIARGGANVPPKKVIRAIQSYRARSPIELSFEKGDFFHVVGERPGEGLFDAANPATGARGLVPASCFQVLGRTERDSRMSNGPTPTAPSNGFGGQRSGTVAAQPAPTPLPAPTKRTSAPTAKSNTLYGVVQYDFVAERGDELDAKRGDNIIIIAQSNHEWFVAKPIGRLGGPGLIPVSFVEIQNMATGKALDPQAVQDMIKNGALPGVEEWKKSTAEYKQSSIALGRFDFAGTPVPSTSASAPPTIPNGKPPVATEQTSSVTKRSTSSSLGPRQVVSHHESSNSRLTPTYPPTHPSYSSPQLNGHESYSEKARFSSSNQSYSASGDPSLTGSGDAAAERYGLVNQAVVESFHYEDESYWFHLRVGFTSRAALVLYRLYDDFYDFQMSLMREFPVEAGRELPADARPGDRPIRILPMMPGPAEVVDEHVCAQRVIDLSTYLADLVGLPDYILTHPLTYDFFLVRPGDVEIEPPSRRSDISQRYRADQAEGELVEQLARMPGGGGGVGGGSVRPSSRSASGMDPHQQRISNDFATLSVGAQRPMYPENGTARPGSQPTFSSTSRNETPSPGPSPGTPGPAGGGGGQPSFLKIKVFQRTTDDLIAIRVPPNVSLAQLIEKASERLGTDIRSLKWREELIGLGPGGGARLVELVDDAQLDRWAKSGAKLVLYAD